MMDSNSHMSLIARLMDVACLRNEVIAHNVANVNTPGHQCLEVQFEDALAQALGASDSSQAAQVAPRVVTGGGGAMRADGNNVDIDLEMSRLHKNSLMFELYSQLLAMHISQHRSAVQGR
jgi:flagellar basal-body rod protein FlgB